MNRTIVLFLFGGESSEHDVSVASARNVYAAMDSDKFDIILGFIDKQGKWWLLDDFEQVVSTQNAPQLVPVLGTRCFMTVPESKMITPDVILPVLHGKNGEDGSVQALAQLLHIPIVGCDIAASALCMDKVATKQIMQSQGVAVVDYVTHRHGDDTPQFDELVAQLGNPLFVKPARAGSSVGVSKVTNDQGLQAALALAHEHYSVALIEKGVTAREIEVAVLGNPPRHITSRPGEIRADGSFYSYNSKYSSDSASQIIIPAELPEEQQVVIQELASRVYKILECKGLARVDFFVTENNDIYLNEVNTFPGFTNISMYPKLWRDSGISYPALIERLIRLALET